jgi:hypothetical protein
VTIVQLGVQSDEWLIIVDERGDNAMWVGPDSISNSDKTFKNPDVPRRVFVELLRKSIKRVLVTTMKIVDIILLQAVVKVKNEVSDSIWQLRGLYEAHS